MTTQEAERLIDSYCREDEAPDVAAAVARLRPYDVGDFALIGLPGNSAIQDLLDTLIYDDGPQPSMAADLAGMWARDEEPVPDSDRVVVARRGKVFATDADVLLMTDASVLVRFSRTDRKVFAALDKAQAFMVSRDRDLVTTIAWEE